MHPAHPVEIAADPTREVLAPSGGVDQQVAELLLQWRAQDSGFQFAGDPPEAPGMARAGERSGSGIAGLLPYLSFNRKSSSN